MAVQAADTLFIKAPQVPILIERNDNVLFYMRMDAKETKTLDEVTDHLWQGCSSFSDQVRQVVLRWNGRLTRSGQETLRPRGIHFQQYSGQDAGDQSILLRTQIGSTAKE